MCTILTRMYVVEIQLIPPD